MGGDHAPNSIVSFAKNGTGLQLQQDRTIRRGGEYLELEWNGNKWAEAIYSFLPLVNFPV